MLPGVLPLKRWLRMCSKMAAKLINSSDESSMGSAVYFSRRVFTENLKQKHTEKEKLEKHNAMGKKFYFSTSQMRRIWTSSWPCAAQADGMQPCTVPKQTNVLLYLNPVTIAWRRVFFFFGNHAILSYWGHPDCLVYCTMYPFSALAVLSWKQYN